MSVWSVLRSPDAVIVLVASLIVNIFTFVQESLVPGSAEHWQVGLFLLAFALLMYLIYRRLHSVISAFTFIVCLFNGILAVLLDVIWG